MDFLSVNGWVESRAHEAGLRAKVCWNKAVSITYPFSSSADAGRTAEHCSVRIHANRAEQCSALRFTCGYRILENALMRAPRLRRWATHAKRDIPGRSLPPAQCLRAIEGRSIYFALGDVKWYVIQ